MNNIKFRKKVLEKIAQTPSTTPATPTATPTVPQPKPALQPPSPFQASGMYPNIRTGFNEASIGIIDQLSSLLHNSLHYATAGDLNFITLKGTNFVKDASMMKTPDSKNLLLFSQKMYKDLFNGNNPFADLLTGVQVNDIAARLLGSSELSNLSSYKSGGSAGNLKTNIITYLDNLKRANPIQAT